MKTLTEGRSQLAMIVVGLAMLPIGLLRDGALRYAFIALGCALIALSVRGLTRPKPGRE